jgi:hypothetical protein
MEPPGKPERFTFYNGGAEGDIDYPAFGPGVIARAVEARFHLPACAVRRLAH